MNKKWKAQTKKTNICEFCNFAGACCLFLPSEIRNKNRQLETEEEDGKETQQNNDTKNKLEKVEK